MGKRTSSKSPDEKKTTETLTTRIWDKISGKYLYLSVNIFTICCTFPCSFESYFQYYTKWPALFPAILISALFFIPWDILFTSLGYWSFNPNSITGYKILKLPIEEWMFFFTVPYSCVFIYEALKVFETQDIFRPIAVQFFYWVIPVIIVLGIYGKNKIYTWTNCVVAIAILLLHYYIFGERLLGRFFLGLAVHYIPFYICNGVMSGGLGKDSPVVFYNEKTILNWRIGTIPIEDAVYSMSLLLANVTVYEYIIENHFEIVIT